MKITITAEDIQFHERDFREHYNRIETAFNCDGVPSVDTQNRPLIDT